MLPHRSLLGLWRPSTVFRAFPFRLPTSFQSPSNLLPTSLLPTSSESPSNLPTSFQPPSNLLPIPFLPPASDLQADLGQQMRGSGGVHCLCGLLQHALRCLRIVARRHTRDTPVKDALKDVMSQQTVQGEVVVLRQLLRKLPLVQAVVQEAMHALLGATSHIGTGA